MSSDPFWSRLHLVQVAISALRVGVVPAPTAADVGASTAAPAAVALKPLPVPYSPMDVVAFLQTMSPDHQRVFCLRMVSKNGADWAAPMLAALEQDGEDAPAYMFLLLLTVRTLDSISDAAPYVPFVPAPKAAVATAVVGTAPEAAPDRPVSLLYDLRTPSDGLLPFVPFLTSRASLLSLLEALWLLLSDQSDAPTRIAFAELALLLVRAAARFCPGASAAAAATAASTETARRVATLSFITGDDVAEALRAREFGQSLAGVASLLAAGHGWGQGDGDSGSSGGAGETIEGKGGDAGGPASGAATGGLSLLVLLCGGLLAAMRVGGAALAKDVLGVHVPAPALARTLGEVVVQSAGGSLRDPAAFTPQPLLQALLSHALAGPGLALLLPLRKSIRAQRDDALQRAHVQGARDAVARDAFLELVREGKLSVKDVDDKGLFDKGIEAGLAAVKARDERRAGNKAGAAPAPAPEGAGAGAGSGAAAGAGDAGTAKSLEASTTAATLAAAADQSDFAVQGVGAAALREITAVASVAAELCALVPSAAISQLNGARAFRDLAAEIAGYDATYGSRTASAVSGESAAAASDVGAAAEGGASAGEGEGGAPRDHSVSGLARLLVELGDSISGMTPAQLQYLRGLDDLAAAATEGRDAGAATRALEATLRKGARRQAAPAAAAAAAPAPTAGAAAAGKGKGKKTKGKR